MKISKKFSDFAYFTFPIIKLFYFCFIKVVLFSPFQVDDNFISI